MTDLSKFEDEILAMKIEYILNAFEYDLQAKANAAIGMMLKRVDELVATGDPITAKQLERATAGLNEVIATELGGAMVDTQAALREVAAEQGEVVAVGPGKLNEDGNRIPMEVKPEDRVLYGKYSGTEVKVEGDDYLILRESDILAIVQ